MLKTILGFFGIVGKATPEQSRESLNKVKSALARRLDDPENYIAVFGYGMKPGVVSTNISCYAIGFSRQGGNLAIVPIYCDTDEIEDLYFFPKEHIKSISMGLYGERIIKSDLIKGDLRIIVPAYTKEDAEDMYQLPIVQMENAERFEKWIKDNF